MEKSKVIASDPEIMSGAVCFKGTRVPAQTLIDALAHGDSLDDFLEGFPSVSRTQAIAFLEESGALLLKETSRHENPPRRVRRLASAT